MIWLLMLHIGALLVWIASLLYLSTLIANPNATEAPDPGPNDHHDSLARFLFTRIATPAALLAIAAGTAVFLVNGTTDLWLIIKLTMVAALVVCHALLGALTLQSEAREVKHLQGKCWALAGLISVLALSIVWVVLAKPRMELLPW